MDLSGQFKKGGYRERNKLMMLWDTDVARQTTHPFIHPLVKDILTILFVDLCMNVPISTLTATTLRDLLAAVHWYRTSPRKRD